jgi:hypothetical protein
VLDDVVVAACSCQDHTAHKGIASGVAVKQCLFIHYILTSKLTVLGCAVTGVLLL